MTARDLKTRLREAEARSRYWTDMAKPERGGEYPKLARVSAQKAKKGLSRVRRRLDDQVTQQQLDQIDDVEDR